VVYSSLFTISESHSIQYLIFDIIALLLSGEFWFCAMSIDLIQSVSNPFTSFSYNLQIYRLLSIAMGVVCGVLFFYIEVIPNATQLSKEKRYFWFHDNVLSHGFGFQEWFFYYLWVVAFMLLSLVSLVYVHR
jgi:1-phosphatidylinositol-4-phosphate 5-kinase